MTISPRITQNKERHKHQILVGWMGGMACVGISRNSYFWEISQISLPDPCVPLQFTTCHIDHTATGMFYSFGCYLNTTLLKIHSIDTMQCGTAWCVPQKALQNEIIGDSRQSSVWITERMRQRHSTEDKLRYSVISMGTQGGAERELEALNKKAGDGESQRRVLKKHCLAGSKFTHVQGGTEK